MHYLFIVSLVWALSFGLIKGNLAGLDSFIISFLRLSISFLIFLPLLKVKSVPAQLRYKLTALGMIQYGFMYLAYIASYKYLMAYQIAILTIMTPIFVTIFADIFDCKWRWKNFFVATLSILGSGIVIFEKEKIGGSITGILLMQLSNILFAIGQVLYRKLMRNHKKINAHNVFAFPFLGAMIVTLIATLLFSDWSTVELAGKQVWVLLYLGVIPAGICFFLWNVGATKVTVGVLAVFNNFKMPMAVAASIFIFGENVSISRLVIGGSIIVLALLIAQVSKKEA